MNDCKFVEPLLLNVHWNMSALVLTRPCFGFSLTLCAQTEQLGNVVVITFSHLGETGKNALELANLEVLINTVVYNPGAVLVLIAAHPGVNMFFDRWFVVVNLERGLPRVHDKDCQPSRSWARDGFQCRTCGAARWVAGIFGRGDPGVQVSSFKGRPKSVVVCFGISLLVSP